jgi:hypothetical protein
VLAASGQNLVFGTSTQTGSAAPSSRITWVSVQTVTSARCSIAPVFTVLALLGCTSQRVESRRASTEIERAPVLQATPVVPTVSGRDALLLQPIDWERNRVMQSMRRMSDRMRETHYVHGIDVHPGKGYFAFDCSGMVDWLLGQAAPVAHRSLHQGLESRPLARDFVFHLARIEPGQRRGGWLRVGRISDARPGDVIAWLKPKNVRSANTGHVAVVVGEPLVRTEGDSAYLVRVADSSRLMHEDDSRHGHGGYGLGTLLIQADPVTLAPSGFSFAGSRTSHPFGTKIVIGRPLQ